MPTSRVADLDRDRRRDARACFRAAEDQPGQLAAHCLRPGRIELFSTGQHAVAICFDRAGHEPGSQICLGHPASSRADSDDRHMAAATGASLRELMEGMGTLARARRRLVLIVPVLLAGAKVLVSGRRVNGRCSLGVTATSARNAWAVGEAGDPDKGYTKTLILHWNGTAWKTVPSPGNARGASSELLGVAAVSDRDARAVGDETLVLHWNGTSRKRVPSPSLAHGSVLTGVAATSRAA